MRALVPAPEDELQHPPEDPPHWSESWYFDAVSDDGSVGVYARIGRVPGTGKALYTAAVVQRDGPTILIVDPDAPLPDDRHQTVSTSEFSAEHVCLEPLNLFQIHLEGTGSSFADHAGPYRLDASEPVKLAADLVWQTDAIPYRWQLTRRYEIPCRVSGTICIGDVDLAFDGPGQRDHSWGPRDWWGHEWMWSAFHLEDGTRIHAVVIDDLPGLMIGYVQHGDELVELTTGSYSAAPDPDGLIRADQIVLGDVGITLDVRPTGFGPLRLESEDGRVTHFTRAMAEVTTQDGRMGTGWIEWNRVQGR